MVSGTGLLQKKRGGCVRIMGVGGDGTACHEYARHYTDRWGGNVQTFRKGAKELHGQEQFVVSGVPESERGTKARRGIVGAYRISVAVE